jgi:hypothetical protein
VEEKGFRVLRKRIREFLFTLARAAVVDGIELYLG